MVITKVQDVVFVIRSFNIVSRTIAFVRLQQLASRCGVPSYDPRTFVICDDMNVTMGQAFLYAFLPLTNYHFTNGPHLLV